MQEKALILKTLKYIKIYQTVGEHRAMKVSLFVHNLSSNPIVRAYPIAKALEMLGYEVEILGLTFNTDKIYEPYKDEFKYITIRSYLDIRWVIINARKLSKLATGDIIYAFKPLWSSLYPAILASRFGRKKRLLLDAEDNELWDAFIGNGFKTFFKNPFYPDNPIYAKILHPATWFIKRKTVVCRSLQKRYGGIIVLHGPDIKRVKSDNIKKTHNEIKKKHNIPTNVFIVLFAGRPVYYNGLETIIDTLNNNTTKKWHLALAGNSKNNLFLKAKKVLKERCHLIGYVPNNNMPEIINIADVVPIIQSPNKVTNMQIPAKLLEAMSLGKIIISTKVADIPEILGLNNNKQRGFIIIITCKKESFIISNVLSLSFFFKR